MNIQSSDTTPNNSLNDMASVSSASSIKRKLKELLWAPHTVCRSHPSLFLIPGVSMRRGFLQLLAQAHEKFFHESSANEKLGESIPALCCRTEGRGGNSDRLEKLMKLFLGNLILFSWRVIRFSLKGILAAIKGACTLI